MIQPHPALPVLQALIDRLGLQVVGPDQMIGVVEGSPVTMTILGGDPLALLLAFKVRSPHPDSAEWPAEVAALAEAGRAEASLENGYGWLSLDNLSGLSADAVAELITRFAQSLRSAGVALPEGCADCTATEDVQLVYVGGRCSRLCADCRERLAAEVEHRERLANGYRFSFALALPLMCLYMAVAWAAVWWGADALMNRRQTNVIAVHPLEGLGIAAVLGGAVGVPTGLFARRAGLARLAIGPVSVALTLMSCMIGEWLYVFGWVYYVFGVLNPLVVTPLMVEIVRGYEGSWVVAKLLTAAAMAGGCWLGMLYRREVVVPL